MKPSTPKIELPPSTQLRKVVFGGALQTTVMKKHFLALVIAFSALTGASTVQAQSIYEPYSFGTLAGLALNSGSIDATGSAISGAFEGRFLKTARMMGAAAVLNKPVSAELLLASVSAVLNLRR